MSLIERLRDHGVFIEPQRCDAARCDRHEAATRLAWLQELVEDFPDPASPRFQIRLGAWLEYRDDVLGGIASQEKKTVER